MLRICKRFVLLRGNKIDNAPLAIYRDKATGRVFNITSTDVVNSMRSIARAVYNLDDDELQLFTCHSIRVGACCTLFSQGFDTAQIKKILR